MPSIKVLLGDAVGNKPLENGTYEAEILKVDGPKEGPNSHYLSTLFKITDEKAAGRQVYYITPIEGKGASMFIDLWNRATDDDVDVDELEDFDCDTDDLVGYEVRIVIKMREYEGDMQPEVKKVLAA